LKEVERLYDVFSVQHNYYLTNDPESLERERSMLFQYGKEKLNTEFSWKPWPLTKVDVSTIAQN
jgi:hypothetical protein